MARNRRRRGTSTETPATTETTTTAPVTEPEDRIDDHAELVGTRVPTFAEFAASLRGETELVGRRQQQPVLAGVASHSALEAAFNDERPSAPSLLGGGYSMSSTAVDEQPSLPFSEPASAATEVAEPPTPRWSYGAGTASAAIPRGPITPASADSPIAHQPLLGPVGISRPPAIVMLLSILTLGLYTISWHRRINREMEDFDARMHVRPARSAFAVFVPWAAGLLITAAGAARIIVDHVGVSLPFDPIVTVQQGYWMLAGIGAIPYLALLFPLSVVAIVMTLERIRVVEDRSGLTADRQLRPARNAAWLVVPIIGGLILVAREQHRLNAVWERVAPPAHSRGYLD